MNPPYGRQHLLDQLDTIVSAEKDRRRALQTVADTLKTFGNYRWVGLYDLDYAAGLVRNLVWSGPGAPEYPTFPINRGLTGAVIASGRTINVGDVAADSRYLTAFGSTQSEIIVPVFANAGGGVVGTIDVESEKRDAFSAEIEGLLADCSERIRPLWLRSP
jgi:putative methionine-R-sulfoxide reductase with GAF domain